MAHIINIRHYRDNRDTWLYYRDGEIFIITQPYTTCLNCCMSLLIKCAIIHYSYSIIHVLCTEELKMFVHLYMQRFNHLQLTTDQCGARSGSSNKYSEAIGIKRRCYIIVIPRTLVVCLIYTPSALLSPVALRCIYQANHPCL